MTTETEISNCSNFDDRYLEVAREYYELNQQKKEIEEVLKCLKYVITTLLKEDKEIMVKIKPYKIMLSEVISKRLDITRIKNDDPEIYQKYLTESKYEKLVISKEQLKVIEKNEHKK